MTKTRKMRIGIVAVLVAASLVAVALPVSGSHADDVKTKDAKGVGPYAYIGLGIGDHIISCPGDTLFTVEPVETVSVHAEDDQGNVLVDGDEQFGSLSPVGGHIKLPGSGFGGYEQDNPLYPLCLGGAFDSDTTDTQPGLPNSWEVWADDFVYKIVRQASLDNVDIVPAMFARLVIQASGGAGVADDPNTCVIGAPPGTGGDPDPTPFDPADVCIHNNENKVMTKVMAQFSACGKGRVTDLNLDANGDPINWWDEAENEFALQGIPIDSYTVTKTVFMDGPLFAFLDCGIGGATVADTYNDVAEWWNNDPGEANPLDPHGVPQHNACNATTVDDDPVPSGLPGLGVCLFDFPAGDSFCWSHENGPGWADEHIAAFGLIGDIGWSVDDNQAGCAEPTGVGPWGKVIAGAAVVIHDGLPASPVTVSVTTTP